MNLTSSVVWFAKTTNNGEHIYISYVSFTNSGSVIECLLRHSRCYNDKPESTTMLGPMI